MTARAAACRLARLQSYGKKIDRTETPTVFSVVILDFLPVFAYNNITIIIIIITATFTSRQLRAFATFPEFFWHSSKLTRAGR